MGVIDPHFSFNFILSDYLLKKDNYMLNEEYNIPIWDGTCGSVSGSTPFGYYDADLAFQLDAPAHADWCARRLGYDLIDVELNSGSMFAAFEESVNEYSFIMNQHNMESNYASLQGMDISNTLSAGTEIGRGLDRIITITKEYGSEAGSGGNIAWHSGSIPIISGQQTYDLTTWASSSGYGDIEIKKIFHEAPAAISRFFDPYATTGMGTMNVLNEFGWNALSPAVNFVMMPMYEDLLRIQAIEFNQMIRKSGYSFRLINNQLQIFPLPTNDFNLHFQYIKLADRRNALTGRTDVVTDPSNVPYERITYAKINAWGKNWIRAYMLAVCKEILGRVRGKYSQIPSADTTITLDSDKLLSEASAEMAALKEQIKSKLDEMSHIKQMEKRSQEAKYTEDIIKQIPLRLYIG